MKSIPIKYTEQPKELFNYHVDDVDLGCEREAQFIRHFIKNNNYPDYETARKIILNDKKIPGEMIVEYGELNHRFMKEAYENFEDTDRLKKIGDIIHKRGGTQALIMNSFAVNRVCNYLIQQSPVKYSQYEKGLVSFINKNYLLTSWGID